MKIKLFLVLGLILTSLFVGCTKKDEPDVVTPDVVTTASIVDNGEDFLKAVGPDAFWLAAIIRDVKIDQDIVVEGEYTKPDKEDETKLVPAGRKIALYAQDADRNKTASYTLTAPKMIVKSKNANIWGGTFVGDVYVQETGFNLVDATIEGNVYFATEELKATFVLDDKSKVTGATEVKAE